MKKLLSCLLALTMVFALAIPALASDFSDISDGAWYEEAVDYVTAHGLMDAATSETFAPEENTPRGVVAEALWRSAGRPTATTASTFTDVSGTDPHKAAIDWAAESGVIGGYGDGRFGPDDLVTREQFAAMMWRSVGRPDAGSVANFADADTIGDYAITAASWSEENGLINGMPGNLFAPRTNITRAMVATILMRYDKLRTNGTSDTENGTKVLVTYFSCTNNTKRIAELVAKAADAELYEITPEIPYTSADLNYGSSSSRTSAEQNDPTARPAISGTVANMDDYDVVFIGYPIWWGKAPMIIHTFMESYDFSGKTVIPFCTSASSGIDSAVSGKLTGATVLTGRRFSGSASEATVAEWVGGLSLPIN